MIWVIKSRRRKAGGSFSPAFRLPNGESDDFEVGHHAHVFVLELVAVNEVEACVSVEADENLDGLKILEENGVLPPPLPREDGSPAAAPRLDLEGGAVDVDGVRGVPVGCEAPAFGLMYRDLEVDAVDVVPQAIDLAHPIEGENARRHRVGQRGDRGKSARDRGGHVDLPRHVEFEQIPPRIQALQHHFRADRQTTEIDEEVEPLRGTELDL